MARSGGVRRPEVAMSGLLEEAWWEEEMLRRSGEGWPERERRISWSILSFVSKLYFYFLLFLWLLRGDDVIGELRLKGK
jgi:predicted transcriptional regulator